MPVANTKLSASRKASAKPQAYALSRALPRTLLHAFYWIDDGLQAAMRKKKGFSLPRSQSIIMVLIGDGVHQQSEIARLLGISKQAVSQAIKELIIKDLVRLEPDPNNGRQKIVTFTNQGRKMRDVARTAIAELEQELSARIGKRRLEALHDALEAPWGDPPV
jgi:DNA-binding MarR family transcriptional regulator